jgi:acyl-CoA synthetase (AMP-forming)/AMP-acid ligase II
MKLFDILQKSAEVFPDHQAVIHNERKINYRELLIETSRLSKYLDSLKLSVGARVGILYENSIEYLIAFFAVCKSNLVAVPIDNSLNAERMNFILADSQAEVLITQAKYERHFPKILRENLSLRHLITDKPLKQNPAELSTAKFHEILGGGIDIDGAILNRNIDRNQIQYDLQIESEAAPHELAAIFYTSGSTGSPKGVMLSHRNLISNTIATVEYLKLTSHDSVIVILPFYYIYGNSLLLTHILTGGTLVIDNRFLYPEVILDTMEKEIVTGFSGVPSNFMILLNNTTFASRKFENLRYFTQAGGAMAPEVVRRLINTFPQKEIYIMYGQTEASPRVSYCPPERLNDKIGAIGIPVPGVTIKIAGENGREMPMGESGELVVSGPNVMMGYWNQPDEEKQVLHDGWLYTGDLARKDDEGYFYIVGRKKEIIKAGGNRVSAKEIEECILENEKIAEVAVFGVKDDILGEAIKAAIVLKNGFKSDGKEIRNFCKSRLADYKVPKYIEIVDSLPKYQSGKVNKVLLKEMSQ